MAHMAHYDHNHADRPIAGNGTSKAGLHRAWVRGCADGIFGRTANVYRTGAERDAWRQGCQTSVLLECTVSRGLYAYDHKSNGR